jgi:uncharacterized alpha-E superfamily protein
MLLSRVADSLYWMSRYLERAEHAARVVDVAVDLGLGRATVGEDGPIERLYRSLGVTCDESGECADALFFDLSSPSSVVACVTAARDNARQVREEISSDMWQQLNGLFLRLKQVRAEGPRGARTHFVSRSVIEGVHLFQGITDATMGHGEGWQYLQVGRFIERAAATARLLDGFLAHGGDPADRPAPLDQTDLVALLRSCSALEAYCRHYTADVRSERVMEFLLLDADFPRSVRFAAGAAESALRVLARLSGRRSGGDAERLAGRLYALLDYAQVGEILNDNPHAYLAGISRQCAQIHAALYQTYVSYSVEAALPA